MKTLIAISALFLIPGCASRSSIYRVAAPLNAVASYFGSVAIHESGHALSASVSGADKINVSILPGHHEGIIHLGFTTATFSHPISSIDETFFNVSGTLTELAAHIACRSMLRSGLVPEELQPTAQWLSLATMIGVYGECIMGLARSPGKDLAKEDIWIGAAILGGALVFDLLDMLTDTADRYIGVLFGEKFYSRNGRTILRFISNGRFFGIGGDF